MSMHSVELALRDLLAVEVARVRTVSESLTEDLVTRSASLGAVLGDSLDSVWTQPEVQGLPHHGAQGRVLANAALRAGTALAATLDTALRAALAEEAERLGELADALTVVQEVRGRASQSGVRTKLEAVAKSQQVRVANGTDAPLIDLPGQLLAALGIDRACAALHQVDLDHPGGWPPSGHRVVVSSALVPTLDRYTSIGRIVRAAFGQLLVPLEQTLVAGVRP